MLPSTRPSPQDTSVKTEFQKYASGEVSAKGTDLLWFWKVRSIPLNVTVAQSLHRPIRMSIRCSI